MLRKILNMVLAALLFVSTTGFTISTHYCGDTVVSTTIGSEAESCEDGRMGDCCHDKSQHFQIEDDFVQTTLDVTIEQTPVQEIICLQLLDLFISMPQLTDVSINSFSPPPPLKTQSVLAKLQLYLI